MSGNLEIIERLDETYRRVGIDAVRGALAGDQSAAKVAAPLFEVSNELIHPDVEVDLSRWESNWPGQLQYRGADGWLSFWRDWLEPWKEFDYRRLRSDEAGDWLISEVDLEVRGLSSGLPVQIRFVQIWGFSEGRARHLSTYETWEAAEQRLAELRTA